MQFLAMAQQKYRMRRFNAGYFSKKMIELIHHRINLVIGYVLKTVGFGKVLPCKPLILSSKPHSQAN